MQVLVALTSLPPGLVQADSLGLGDHMLQGGLVDLLLAALAALPAITKPTTDTAPSSSHLRSSGSMAAAAIEEHVATSPPPHFDNAGQSATARAASLSWPVVIPFIGYRTDVVAGLKLRHPMVAHVPSPYSPECSYLCGLFQGGASDVSL